MRLTLASLILFSSFQLYSATASRFEKLELFNKVLHLIETQYYRTVDTDKLIEGALKGMMETLDPHSAYMNKNVFAKMQEETQGEFGGLGVEVTQRDGYLTVVAPIDDTPAFKAGILSGDRIVEIQHESVIGVTLEQAVDKMKGPIGGKISLAIKREGEDSLKYFELKRELIKVDSVKSAIIQNEYAYIRLSQFQQKSAESIIKAMQKIQAELEKKKLIMKGIVLDLRSNPGGLLDEAVDVASLFLKDGIVVSTEGRDPKNKDIRYVKKEGYKAPDVSMIILINGSSASAAEIVSGALQDHKRAMIMGSRSFGKGSVQTIAKIDEEKGIKLTIAQYMTPNNRKIQALGIQPDILLSETTARWVEENMSEDSVLHEADLRNHLTAAVETKEEEALRVKREQEIRTARMKKIQNQKDSKSKAKDESKDGPEERRYLPAEDFQVNEAVNYLKVLAFGKK